MLDYALHMGITDRLTGRNDRPDELVDWFDYFGGEKEPENEYRFLSNFHVGEPISLALRVGDRQWPRRSFQTGEHAFAAAKATSPFEFVRIADAADPSEAKALGRTTKLTPEWETCKDSTMGQVLRAKFTLGREEGRQLLDTGDALLVESTWWADTIWGIDLRHPQKIGENRLGRMLMARRAELRFLETRRRQDLYLARVSAGDVGTSGVGDTGISGLSSPVGNPGFTALGLD